MEFISVTDSTKKSSALGRRKTLDGVKQRSRWSNGLTFSITGVDVVYDKDKGDEDNGFVVFTTTVNGNKFDNLFLSTLVRPITDKDGQDVVPDGELNKIAIGLMNDPTVTTDGEFANRILTAIAGRQIKVKRDRKVVRMSRSGDFFVSMLLEFTF